MKHVKPVNKQLQLSIRKLFSRLYSTPAIGSLDSSRLQITRGRPNTLKDKPTVDDLTFGKNYSDHMFKVRWTQANGWEAPKITPLENLSLHPGAKVLHYAQEIFEGMKAFRGEDDKIRLFRPMHNMARMNMSAERSQLPIFNGLELLNCIRGLVELEQEWVPRYPGSSLYIRPTMIGTEPILGVNASNEAELFVLLCPVGPYFKSGIAGVNLLADPRYVRAFPGGSGYVKVGSNYAPTLWTQKIAAAYNCEQNLWLYGEDHEITECGAMNVFFLLKQESGKAELVTPCLDKGLVLPGITRRSIVEAVRERWSDEFDVSERKITMKEMSDALKSGRLIEAFGSGTAAIVCPIKGVHYNGKLLDIPMPENSLSGRIRQFMSDIYYGRIAHPWMIDIEAWDVKNNDDVNVDYKLSEMHMSF